VNGRAWGNSIKAGMLGSISGTERQFNFNLSYDCTTPRRISSKLVIIEPILTLLYYLPILLMCTVLRADCSSEFAHMGAYRLHLVNFLICVWENKLADRLYIYSALFGAGERRYTNCYHSFKDCCHAEDIRS
jgi:hypothetical protein